MNTATKMTGAQFDEALEMLRSANASLRGCKRSEVPNEAAILRRAMDRVANAEMARFSNERSMRRANLLEHAEKVLAFCEAH